MRLEFFFFLIIEFFLENFIYLKTEKNIAK